MKHKVLQQIKEQSTAVRVNSGDYGFTAQHLNRLNNKNMRTVEVD